LHLLYYCTMLLAATKRRVIDYGRIAASLCIA
jgi:hypothetical protein